MSARLDAYIALERIMFELDEASDELAESIRDMMDPLWYALSDDERSVLDARKIGEVHALNPIRLSVAAALMKPHRLVGRRIVHRNRKLGVRIRGKSWLAWTQPSFSAPTDSRVARR